MNKKEALALMEKETWLPADKAKELKLIDGIMFEKTEPLRFSASTFDFPSEDKMNRVKELINEQTSTDDSAFLIEKIKAQHKLLDLRGER